jgi:hypothetical protein
VSVNKTFYFKMKQFAAGELGTAAQRVCSRVCNPEYSVSVYLYRTLGDGTEQRQSKIDTSLLSTVCDLQRENVSFDLTFAKRLNDNVITGNIIGAHVWAYGNVLVVRMDADSADQLREFSRIFAEEFGLQVAPAPVKESNVLSQISALAERVAALERDRAALHRLTCFLSFHFEGRSLKYGQTVKQLLELLGVRVITGQGYEPMPVNEKVRSRLAENIDLIVVIETAGIKSSWTRDEMARAQNPGVFLIPLVENGAVFEAGIFGDHEYIPFAEDHVSDAFIGLIEGIQYVERVRATAEPVAAVDGPPSLNQNG